MLELTGLDGTNPLGLLAAVGTIKIVHENRTEGPPRLAWQENGTWIPLLETDLDRDGLLNVLQMDIRTWRNDPALDLKYPKSESKPDKLSWDLKPPPHRFRAYLQGLLDPSSAAGHRAARYAAAFAAEGVVDNKGATKPLPLHFTAGQQEFLAMVADLIGVDDEGVDRDDFAEALFGPWTYSRSLPVLAWDSTANRDYALRGSNPSTDKKLGVPGADWLAFRGLAVLRSTSKNNRLVTTGCYGGWKNGGFHWPLWNPACTYHTIEALINMPGLPDLSAHERRARGISCVLQSRIRRTDQGGYGTFSPSELL